MKMDSNRTPSSEAKVSVEGAYEMAIEAAAQRIQLGTQESSISSSLSGYCSDAEEDMSTSGQDSTTEETSLAADDVAAGYNRTHNVAALQQQDTESEDYSYTGASGSSSDEDEDIESEIAFLEEKRIILKRACIAMKREEAYTASRAHAILGGDLPCESKLWSEAKLVLEVLRREGKVLDRLSQSPTPSSDTKCQGKRKIPGLDLREALLLNQPPPKRPKIDISTVHHVTSSSFQDSSAVLCPNTCLKYHRLQSAPGYIRDSRHWMSRAMAYQIPALAGRSASQSLDVLVDHTVGLMVVAPNHIPFQNAMQLTTALEFSSCAQVITLPTPPFSVVHANKAFWELSGLSHADVIGKSVEAILKVERTIPNFSSAGSSRPVPLKSRFRVSASAESLLNVGYTCQIFVAPITDRSQNTRGMTHVLVKIEPLENERFVVEASTDSDTYVAVSDQEKTLNASITCSDDNRSRDGAHRITVG